MNAAQITPVILSGGAGTRMWPSSRALQPKQFQALTGEGALLRETLHRVADPLRFSAPSVVCAEPHRFLVLEQLRMLARDGGSILVEPGPRGTAAAACVAALRALARTSAALLLLLPAQSVVLRQDRFFEAVDEATAAAREGWFVTFAAADGNRAAARTVIQPGEVLACGGRQVAAFTSMDTSVEPPLANGTPVVANGWPACQGLYLVSAQRLIDVLSLASPGLVDACARALAAAKAEGDVVTLHGDAYGDAPDLDLEALAMASIDRRAVVQAEMGWGELDTWASLWRASHKDEAGNAASGNVVALETSNSLLRSDTQLLATLGVDDLVVVATDDAVLVCPRRRTEDVGELVGHLRASGHEETQLHTLVHRPWGSYQCIHRGDGFQVKRLTVAPGRILSLQRHRHRSEHWVVVAGEAEVTRDREVFRLRANQSTYVPLGAVHRLANRANEPLDVIEVQYGDYLGEDDIERFEDAYGRVADA